ncbi:MAG TPA: hypothetical protein VI485_30360 [Vicinamibacterales bacterium]|nr:hypothetical protein [Vicinamibacterales bacterium]
MCASVVGIASAWNLASQDKTVLASLVGVGTIGVLVFTATQHVIGLTAARKKDSTHELEGCLYTLHAVLGPGDGCKVRLAIHVPVDEALEQVTEYIGDTPKPGRVGRRFPGNAGIIGKAFREKDVFIGRRVNDDYESYVRELVTEWNYTEERARRLNPGAMEWMAVPFYDADRHRVEAVLYLDANKRDFFTAERQELVLAAVNGIAVFVGKRYR